MSLYFTIATANNILPDVIRKYEIVLQKRNAVIEIEQHIDTNINIEIFVKLKQKLNYALTELYSAISDLENMGIIIKSIDDGLVDFPSKHFSDDVWLCWKYGETQIKFWHEKNVGFSGRKPICVNDETLI